MSAARVFRSPESIAAEQATRERVGALLERHGFSVAPLPWKRHGSAITQVIDATLPGRSPMRLHVRTCWRRGRKTSETRYAAAQLRARLDDGGWERTLANIAARHEREGVTHLMLVQDSDDGFAFAALVPSPDVPAVWARQRAVSDDILRRGLAGRTRKNHAENGNSPTIWLQDDRHPGTPAIADALWRWPGVVNVLALPVAAGGAAGTDTYDDLGGGDADPGRDGADPTIRPRSGYPRDPAVRAAVRTRAQGRCEREGCGEHRDYPGFLDVHHILGIDVSDRTWTCVALCPNCHREAHFAPDRDAINGALATFASRFR